MKFKDFYESTQTGDVQTGTKSKISQIITTVQSMDDDEFENFAEWLYHLVTGKDDYDFDRDEIIELINDLDSESLDYVYYVLSDEYEDDEDDDIDNDDYLDDDDDYLDDDDDIEEKIGWENAEKANNVLFDILESDGYNVKKSGANSLEIKDESGIIGTIVFDPTLKESTEDSKINERKFFKTRKVQLDRAKKKNILQRRKDKKDRKKYYRKNKAKIKIKNKRYRRKVKRNPNMVKTHRK